MGFLNYVWRKLTPTKELETINGEIELAFFESVYRAVYLTGLSASDRGMFYKIYSSAAKFMITMFVLSELWCLSDERSLDGIITNINATLMHLIAIYRYWMLRKHKITYKKLAMATESPYFDNSTLRRQQIVEYWMNNNERYFKLILSLGTGTLIGWYLYPFLDDVEYNLAVAVKLPFSYQTPSRYGITYLTVIIFFHFASYFVMVNDLIMQAHLTHLLCQFDVLGDCFENIIVDYSEDMEGLQQNSLDTNVAFIEKYLKRLGELVEQHKFILSNTMELRRILSMPMLAQLATSAMLICVATYQVTESVNEGVTKFMMSLLYLGYNMCQLFIFCRWCDEIKEQSGHIGEAVYFSGWESLAMVPGVRSRLLIIIARASQPLVLSAGGLYDLSLNSYATLVKTSYSALTVLLQTKHK